MHFIEAVSFLLKKANLSSFHWLRDCEGLVVLRKKLFDVSQLSFVVALFMGSVVVELVR